MSEHAKTLEPKFRALHEELKKIASERSTEQLITIIQRPGFTTPREAEFVQGVHRAHHALITVADKIGRE